MGFNLDRRMYDVLAVHAHRARARSAPSAARRWREVGGVSDDTLAEDTDLTMALCRAGWRVVYEETARAWTEAPASLGQLWKQRYRWCYGTMQAMWKHRARCVERGPAGRFGRRGLLVPAALPGAPAAARAGRSTSSLLYGLVFLDPDRPCCFWLGFTARPAASPRRTRSGWTGNRWWPLWSLPLQQFVYRQLMYLVVIQSVFTAATGCACPGRSCDRTGDVRLPRGPDGSGDDR